MKKLQETNKENGITLVALVITIIILLILATISIQSLTNTGLFKKANMAANSYKESQIDEQIKLAKLEIEMNSKNKSIKDVLIENGNITEEQSKKGIINVGKNSVFITNYDGLKEISKQAKNGDDFSNKIIYIIDDIDCGASFNIENGELQKGENFEPISNFNGILDGNGYSIKNLYIKTESSVIALISNINEQGTVKNLVIDNAYIEGNRVIGSIAGRNCGTISNCISQNAKITGSGNISGTVIGGICGYNYAKGKLVKSTNKSEVISKYKLCGGICGYSLGGNISNCTNYGKITGNGQVGGIAGDSEGKKDNIVTVSDCINYGEINEKYNKEQNGEIGGIVGCNYKYSEIINCTNKANVNGISTKIGGIAGLNYYNIKKCYNEGLIETTRTEVISSAKFLFLGGICGFSSGNIEECGNIGEIKSNYNIQDDSDGRFVGGICGAISLASDQEAFDNVKISKSFNYGTVNGLQFVGGITGRISTNSSVEYCFNNGKISGDTRIGGISGDVAKNNAKIINCYNIGEVSGNNEFGGLCGALENCIENSYTIGKVIYNNSSKNYGAFLGINATNTQCKNCYYLKISGMNAIGYEKGTVLSNSIIGKTTEELKNLAQILGDAYLQDNNINNGYPYLKDIKPIK